MGLLDYEAIFSDAQDVTVDTESDNYIDTQVAGRAIKESYLVVNVQTTMDTSGEAGTLVVKLQTDDNDSFGSATDLFTSRSFAESELVAGFNCVRIKLPDGLERYIRVYYDVNNSDAFTSGNIDAYLEFETRLPQ